MTYVLVFVAGFLSGPLAFYLFCVLCLGRRPRTSKRPKVDPAEDIPGPILGSIVVAVLSPYLLFVWSREKIKALAGYKPAPPPAPD